VTVCRLGMRPVSRLVGLHDENRKHGIHCLSATLRGSISRGVSGATGGSLMTVIRKPAAVKASVIACSGRRQKRSTALWPPAVHSTV
jgi:hypothetical protein